jgi:DNA processing protein
VNEYERRRLDTLLSAVAAEGTDPEALLSVLAWVARPRQAADALRRRCLEQGTDAAAPARQLADAAGPADPTAQQAVAPLLVAWLDAGVHVALVGDPGYPARLAEGWPGTEAPSLLGWRGRPCDDRPSVALVGSRRASGYGAGVAAWLAETVARAGVRVVSGGAVGVDAAAHGAALDEEGGTTVVLGCGHAVAYPRPHAAPGGLFDRIVERDGTLLSELLPWQRPKPGTVRARNRIVAGLSDLVVVVEGGGTSGALLTATAAAERGVPVLAVPGDVRAPGSVAPHRLLAEGAAPCTGPADVFESLPVRPAGCPSAGGPQAGGGDGRVSGRASTGTAIGGRDPAEGGAATGPVGTAGGLPAAVHDALAAAWPRPVRIDELAGRTGCSPATLLAAVTRARVAGYLAESVDGVRLRRAPEDGRAR